MWFVMCCANPSLESRTINLCIPRRRRFAGTEHGSRELQGNLNPFCERVRATEHAPRGPFDILERRHGLAEVVERGAGVVVERPRVRIILVWR